MDDVQCRKLGTLVMLENRNLGSNNSKTSFVDDKQHLESVLGLARESWFEEFTISKIQLRKCEDVEERLNVMNSPSCSPTISQLINGHLTVGSSPLRHSSPAPWCKSEDSFTGRFNVDTPQTRWNRPLLGLSPCPSPIVQNVAGASRSGLFSKLSLGADDSTLSWTNSLATPPRDTSITSMLSEEDCMAMKTKETARALFSPGGVLDSTNESVQPLDSTVEDIQSDTENHSKVDSNLSDVEKGCGNLTNEKVEVNVESCEIGSLGSENVKHKGETTKETFKKRLIERKESSSEKNKKLKRELKSFSAAYMKESDLPEALVGTITVDKNYCDKSEDVSIASPTFSQKSKRKKIHVRNTSLRVCSPEGGSPVSDILSDFFDPPSSSLRRRRPAPSYKRKSLEMEESPYCLTPKLAFHDSPMLNSSITPIGSLKSILSSDNKNKDSSNKKVRFSKSVKKCCYIPEPGSCSRSPKSVHKSRKKKPLIRSSNTDDDEVVTFKVKNSDIRSDPVSSNRLMTVTDRNQQNKNYNSKGKHDSKTRRLDHDQNNPCKKKNLDKRYDTSKDTNVISKQSDLNNLRNNIDNSLKVLPSDCELRLDVIDKSRQIGTGKNSDGGEQTSENESPKDELFSQVSQTALNEMCSVAEHSLVLENDDDSNRSPIVEDKSKTPVNRSLSRDRKTGKLTGRKKFFYPSLSVKSGSNSSKIFQYQEDQTDSNNKKKLLQSISLKDMIVTTATEERETSAKTLKSISDVEKDQIESDSGDVPKAEDDMKPVMLGDMKLVTNKHNRMVKRNPNMSTLASCSSREENQPDLLSSDAAKRVDPGIGFHCASGKSFNVSFKENMDYQTKTDIENVSNKTEHRTGIDTVPLDTSLMKNTEPSDSNLISTRYSKLSRSNIDKKADEPCEEVKIKLAREQANCVPNAATGFQSASGKSCNISSSALKKAESLLEDDKTILQPNTVTVETESVSAVKEEFPESFSDRIKATAVIEEEYEFSEWPDEDMDPTEGLLFTSEVFEDDVAEDSKEIDSEDSVMIDKSKLKLTEQASEEGHHSVDNLLQNTETFDSNNDLGVLASHSDLNITSKSKVETNQLCQKRVEVKEKQCINYNQTFVGFSTASGTTIKITDEKLKQAESLLEAQKDKENVDKHVSQNAIQISPESEKKFIGFQMASGKTVKITDEKLKQAESLLDSEKDKENVDVPLMQQGVKSIPACEQKFVGFQMASGKTVKTTDEKLKQVEFLLNSERDKENVDVPLMQQGVKSIPACEQKFVGFQMASGKTVDITDEKLKQAESILILETENDKENVVEHVNQHEVNRMPECRQKSVGFQMASGKSVKITEEKLKQAEYILDSENVDMPLKKNDVINKTFVGFQMASGKTIEIADEKLRKAECMLDNKDEEEKVDISNTKHNAKSCLGFQMASGKDVHMTDEKLKHAKTMLDVENDGLGKFDEALCEVRVKKTFVNSSKFVNNVEDNDLCSSVVDFMKQGNVCDKQTSNSTLPDLKPPELTREFNNVIGVPGRSLGGNVMTRTANKLTCMSETKDNNLKSLFEDELEKDVHSMENELDMLGELKSKILNGRGEIVNKSKSLCLQNSNRSQGKESHPVNPSSLPKGFRPFKAPKMVTKSNVKGKEDLKFNITQFKSNIKDVKVKPLDSAVVNHGLKRDKSETNNKLDGICTNLVVADNINNQLVEVQTSLKPQGLSGNNQVHSNNKENPNENQKSSLDDKNDNDLFQGLSQFFEDEMDFEEIDGNVQCGETDDTCAYMRDVSTEDNSIEKNLNTTHTVHTEGASSESATLSLNHKLECNKKVSDASSTVNNVAVLEVLSPVTTHSTQNQEEEIDCSHTLDGLNSPHITSVAQQQKLSFSGNIKVMETTMNDSGFGTGSSNISKLTDGSLNQTDDTFNVTIDQIKANNSAIDVSSRVGNNELGKFVAPNQPSVSLCGFKTASGIEIKMSDSALHKARKTLVDADIIDDAKIIEMLDDESELDKVEMNGSGDVTQADKEVSGPQKDAISDRNLTENVVVEGDVECVKSYLSKEKDCDDCVLAGSISQITNVCTALGIQTEVTEGVDVEEMKISDSVQPVSSVKVPTMKKTSCNENTKPDGQIFDESDSVSNVTDPENKFMFCDYAMDNVKPSNEHVDKGSKIDTSLETTTLNDTAVESNIEQSLNDMPKKTNLESDFNNTTQALPKVAVGLETGTHFVGFTSGKNVTVCAEALEHARAGFDYDTMDTYEDIREIQLGFKGPTSMEEVNTEQTFKGFSTASGKKVAFSEQALKHAKDTSDGSMKKIDIEQTFKGFSTASGRKVAYSEDALKHAKDTLDGSTTKVNTEQTFKGFSTASGKKVACSEDALKHAKGTMDSAMEEVNKEQTFKGFSTASGKKVAFSEQALKYAKDTSDGSMKKIDTEQTFKGFSTASGKKVACSEQALKHAKDTLDGSMEEVNKEQTFKGFSTASGKKVACSEQALKHAKDTLDDSTKECNTEQTFKGLSTASGRKVEFSELALKHAKNTLDGSMKEVNTELAFKGFSMASGKKEEFSEQALKHAKDSLDSVVDKAESGHNCMGFSTASGKKVEFSEQALKHAKNTLDSVVDEAKIERHFVGFSTASGQKVAFSEQALKHAKLTLDSASKITENEHNFMGFNTASGQQVECSESALEHVKQTLKDNLRRDNDRMVPPCSITSRDEDSSTGKLMTMSKKTVKCPVMLGFSTAGGKNVDVSEIALNFIKTSVLHDQSAGVDIDDGEDEGGQTHEDNSDDMEEIFANALKRQKLDVNKERRLLQVSSEENCTLKRKIAKTASPDINPDKRHPGFRPFKPVFCKTDLVTKNNCSLETVNPTGKSTMLDNMSFKTPYKTPVSDGQKTSSNAVNDAVPELAKGDAPGFAKGDAPGLVKEGAPELAPVNDFGPALSDNVLPGSHGDNVDTVTAVGDSLDRTNDPVKKLTDASVDVTVTESVSKEFERNVQAENVEAFLETTTTLVNDAEHKHSINNVDNTNSNPSISDKFAEFRNGNLESRVQNLKSTDSTVTKTHGKNLKSSDSTAVEVTDNGSANNVQNDSYDFDLFSQDEEDVYYCMLVEARASQDSLIKQRSASRVQPVAGQLWNMKQTKGRWKLQDFIEKKALLQKCSVYSEVTSRTAAHHKFKMEQHYGKNKANVTIGDGAYLVPDDSGKIGKYEIYRAFLTIEGVDSKLITDTWVYNHYRWIVWKLAAYERVSASPQSSCLTPTVVLLQLKYRYDREVDRAQRCSIKKIFERDDTPSKRMVLCVADVRHINIEESSGANQGHRTVLELSDGWYGIPTQIDLPLTQLVESGRIWVGQKLCISGAELVGGDDACTPLEAPASIMLKIGRNSVRPAAWDCKLGYQGDPRPLCVPLSGLCSEGGIVGTVDVVIVRKYPTMYMEKLEGGGCTFRTSKCEERARQEFDTQKQAEMEKVYRLVESTAEKDDAKDKKVVRRKTFTRTSVEGFQTGREIYDAIEEAARPDTVQNYLSDHQMSMLYEYQREVMEEKQSEMNSKFRNAWEEKSETFKERVVTPMLKFRVSGCANRDLDSKTSTILTVWRPSAEISDVQEGHRYKIYSVNTSMSRSKYIGHTVQLTATKQTRYRRMQLDENILDNIYEAREVLLVSDVKRYQPIYGELDFVGVIVKIVMSSQSNRAGDMVYLADYQAGIIAMRFTNGFKSFGEDLFVVGNMMCCCNLMDKFLYRNHSIPTVDATTEFTQISNKPLNVNQRKSVDRLNSSLKDKKLFINNALSVISESLVDKEPVPVYEKIKHLNEEFKVQFPNRSQPDQSKINNNNVIVKTSPGGVSSQEEASVQHDRSKASTAGSNVCGSLPNCRTSLSDDNAEIACDKLDIANNMQKSENSVTSDDETKTIEGSSSGQLIRMASTPEVNQADSTPVTQRRRSIAKTKMSRLLSYGSPAVLSPLSLSVPRSVNRGFKPPAFKKL